MAVERHECGLLKLTGNSRGTRESRSMIPTSHPYDRRGISCCAACVGEERTKALSRLLVAFKEPRAVLLLYLDHLSRAAVLEINPRPLPVGRLPAVALRVVIYLPPEIVRDLREEWSRLVEFEAVCGHCET